MNSHFNFGGGRIETEIKTSVKIRFVCRGLMAATDLGARPLKDEFWLSCFLVSHFH